MATCAPHKTGRRYNELHCYCYTGAHGCLQSTTDRLEKQPLHYVPGVAVTNGHSLGGLQQQKFILTVLEARSPKSRYQQGPAPQRLQGRFLSCRSSVVAAVIPWSTGASLQSLRPWSHVLLDLASPLSHPESQDS